MWSSLHRVSVVAVVAIGLAYAATWARGSADALLSPLVQNDDARTLLFPFHRYSAGAPLADDPIANEMLAGQPLGFRLLYRVLVPQVGVLYAAKLVQGLCILIIGAAGALLLGGHRGGLGAAVLLVFLFLRDPLVMNRILGGLPRAFAFPAFALWLAGGFGERPWARRSAALLAAVTYPPAMAMVLGADGLYALRSLGRAWTLTLRRLGRYAMLVAACAVLSAPAVLFDSMDAGPMHTLEQAAHEPAFGRSGRLRILPLEHPGPAFATSFLSAFRAPAASPTTNRDGAPWHDVAAIALVALLVALPLAHVSPSPVPVVAFLVASLALYAVSVAVAFQLYAPARYYTFGMRAVALGLTAAVLGYLLPRATPLVRHTARNGAAAAAMVAAWICLGAGVHEDPRWQVIDYRAQAPLWDFIRTLPVGARIAAHIDDGDDIPLFTQRANTGGYETLQPWRTRAWARQKARAEDTLRALYATDPRVVLDYAARYRVTHLLVNRQRYGRDFLARSRSFEPLTTFARALLDGVHRRDLVLAEPPADAVVFRHHQFLLVDVDRLGQAWAPLPAPGAGGAAGID